MSEHNTCGVEQGEPPSLFSGLPWVFMMISYIALHLTCFAALFVKGSTAAVAFAFLSYGLRMFFVTAFLHRYFSHRSFKTSRWMQFIMAFLACTAGQGGVIWWASQHRHHHQTSDGPGDPHSPVLRGFWKSHVGWFWMKENRCVRWVHVRDWSRFSELIWLNRFSWVPLILFALLVFAIGQIGCQFAPRLGTSGLQFLVWGFAVPTVAAYHATYSINSLAHLWGNRPYNTPDHSRNNFFLAILTLGEGWHNNHHHCPIYARQGLTWWQLDFTYYVLCLMRRLGLIWDLRIPSRGEVHLHSKADWTNRNRGSKFIT